MKKNLLLLVIGLLGTVVGMQGQPLLRTHVETGDVEGVLDSTLAVYKAIPYAAPPVGKLRWKAPQPARAWEGVRVCNEFGKKNHRDRFMIPRRVGGKALAHF